MSFQGSLAELPLPDIIQLVAVSGKTGRFDLTSDNDRGQIFLRDGQIVHARTGALQGEEAVYELAIWPIGDFVFTQDRVPKTVTIAKSNTNLLMEAARRVDEWQVLSKKIDSTHRVPVFTGLADASVSFSPQEWALICKIDERRTIEEIAISLGISPFEACKQLYGLVTAGHVVLREDLVKRLGPRLHELGEERLRLLLDEIYSLGRERLTPPHHVGSKRLPDLETALQMAFAELAGGRGVDATVDMVRSVERLLASERGEDEAALALKRIQDLLA